MALPKAVKDSLQVDAGRLALTAPVRTTLVVMAIVGVTQATGRIEMGIIMSIGALFTGIADPSDANWPRLRTMLSVAWWCSFASVLGVAVANSSWFHLTLAFVVAAACGYVGVLGPRAALGGTLTLVVFVVYAGSPPKLYTPLEIGALTAAGGAALIVVAVVPWILSRHSGVRSAAATAYRNLSLAAAGTIATTSTSIADACGAARGSATAMPHSLRLQAWLAHLAELSQQTRLGLIALDHAQNQAAQPGDAANVMRSDAARLARQVARAVVWPVRSRALAADIERLEQSRQVVVDEGAVEPVLVMAATSPLIDAARQVAAPWPHGRVGHDSTTAGAAGDTATQALTSPRLGMWARLAPRGRFANHAVRLAVAVSLATALTTFGDFPHEYWLPMTVAWMARPDLGGTLSRVGLRVVGTIVGVTVSALILSVFTPGTVGITLLVGVATLLASVFIFANYAIAVVGITMFVLILFSTSGESVSEDVVLRTAATVLAGVITLAIAFVRPERQADRLVSVLASTASALHAYARAAAASLGHAPPSTSLSTTGIDDARAQILAARSNAQTTLSAAEHEPGGHGIAVSAGRELLSAMVDTAAEIFTIELLHPSVTSAPSTPAMTPADSAESIGSAPQLHGRHVESAHDLHQRLLTLDATGAVPARSVSPSGATVLDRHLHRAHQVLDDLPGIPEIPGVAPASPASTPAAPSGRGHVGSTKRRRDR
jgi:uncharacterized membrane protein YccC